MSKKRKGDDASRHPPDVVERPHRTDEPQTEGSGDDDKERARLPEEGPLTHSPTTPAPTTTDAPLPQPPSTTKEDPLATVEALAGGAEARRWSSPSTSDGVPRYLGRSLSLELYSIAGELKREAQRALESDARGGDPEPNREAVAALFERLHRLYPTDPRRASSSSSSSETNP